MAYKQLPTTCTEAQLYMADLIEPYSDWEQALRVALVFAEQIVDVPCKDSGKQPHRIVWTIAGVINSMTDAELAGMTPREFARYIRNSISKAVRSHEQNVEEATRKLEEFTNSLRSAKKGRSGSGMVH